MIVLQIIWRHQYTLNERDLPILKPDGAKNILGKTWNSNFPENLEETSTYFVYKKTRQVVNGGYQ